MVVKVKMRVKVMQSVFSFSAVLVLTFDEFVGHGGVPLERQKQVSHVYRKTGTLAP